MMHVYLLHFDHPFYHAQHYLGTTKNLPFRIQQHRSGEGSPLVKAVMEAGISVHLANTWEGGRDLERQFKRRHNSRKLCPICRAEVRLHDLRGCEGGAQ
jgi:predicted GIY-YIG superfamily endonuclease